jgi:Flp pilus assembly protein TadB
MSCSTITGAAGPVACIHRSSVMLGYEMQAKLMDSCKDRVVIWTTDNATVEGMCGLVSLRPVLLTARERARLTASGNTGLLLLLLLLLLILLVVLLVLLVLLLLLLLVVVLVALTVLLVLLLVLLLLVLSHLC